MGSIEMIEWDGEEGGWVAEVGSYMRPCCGSLPEKEKLCVTTWSRHELPLHEWMGYSQPFRQTRPILPLLNKCNYIIRHDSFCWGANCCLHCNSFLNPSKDAVKINLSLTGLSIFFLIRPCVKPPSVGQQLIKIVFPPAHVTVGRFIISNRGEATASLRFSPGNYPAMWDTWAQE